MISEKYSYSRPILLDKNYCVIVMNQFTHRLIVTELSYKWLFSLDVISAGDHKPVHVHAFEANVRFYYIYKLCTVTKN